MVRTTRSAGVQPARARTGARVDLPHWGESPRTQRCSSVRRRARDPLVHAGIPATASRRLTTSGLARAGARATTRCLARARAPGR